LSLGARNVQKKKPLNIKEKRNGSLEIRMWKIKACRETIA
jgi:hypothetical protein